jgi:hypothetical protein
MLTASGSPFSDWSSAYRLFKGRRMDIRKVFGSLRRESVLANDLEDPYIYAHMDDTLLRKRGKKIYGTGWIRDPLGPPFASNFVWGQRFIQVSLSLMEKGVFGPSRAIPVDFSHCPPVKKPSKNADPQEIATFIEQQKKEKMSAVGIQRIITLREELNADGFSDKKLILSVDGSYTNETVIKKLPSNVELIGRIRKDAKLYAPAEIQPGQRGRKPYYGRELPTPEQVRQNQDIPYQKIEAWAAGKLRTFQVKTLEKIRWRKSGNRDLMLIVIRPVSYRLTKNSRLLYRNPAYLISTSSDIDLRLLVQAYIRRWEIEVGFRDQKTLIGCGQAQVREKIATEKVPAFISACYGMMLLAAQKTNAQQPIRLPATKWYKQAIRKRLTTGDILNRIRMENWLNAVKINLTDFMKVEQKLMKSGKMNNPILAAVFYNRN